MFVQTKTFKEAEFMYLEAFSIGYALPRQDFDASVHSVFQSAANLRLTKGGKLLTLVGADEADLPQGIRLNTPTGFSFAGLCVGESQTCRDGLLRLESLSLTIDLRQARTWKCDLPSLNAELANPAVESAWRSAWQALNKRQLHSGAEIVADDFFRSHETLRAGVPRKAWESMQGLVRGTQQYDLTVASPLVRALIGLGSGLTPSGDDLLAGYLSGLWCAVRGQYDREKFISDLGMRVVGLSRGTNDISRTYLYHAARGQVSSRLSTLSEAICNGANVDSLLDIAETAMQVGHTSGMDAVTGLLVGLTVWNNSGFYKK